jgi:uncharacterized RDD family membrane protein YckC
MSVPRQRMPAPDFGKRLGAFVLDALLGLALGAPGFLPMLVGSFVLPKFVGLLTTVGGKMPLPTQVLIAVTAFASKYWLLGVPLLLFALLAAPGLVFIFLKEGLPNGQSPGKRRLGLATVDAFTGRPCGYAASAVRALLSMVLLVPPLTLIELLFATLRSDGRRVADLAAGTQVVAAQTVGIDSRGTRTRLMPWLWLWSGITLALTLGFLVWAVLAPYMAILGSFGASGGYGIH